MDIDDRVIAGTGRLGPDAAGELLTLQLAAWVREGHDAGTIAIPPLQEGLSDIQAQLADPGLTIWGFREAGRLLATVRYAQRPEKVMFIGRLGVVPDLFRQGIGSAMLRLAEARLPADTRRVELVTGIRSLANHAFYARHGYAIVDRDPEVGIVRLAKDVPRR